MRSRSVAVLALAIAGSALLAAQISSQPPASPQTPVFRTGIDIVHMDVSVIDNDRKPVRGLTAADFTVLEDGKPQHIAAFSAVDVPGTALPAAATWARTVSPDVTSNALDERRLVVIFMDNFTDPLTRKTALKVAHTAVEQMGPLDIGAVVFAAGGGGHGFTSDRRRLDAAIDTLPPIGRVVDACGMDSLFNVADALRSIPDRRKIVIWVTRGLGLIPEDGSANLCAQRAYEALRAAQLANVSLYAADPGGLVAPSFSGGQINLDPGRAQRDFLLTMSNTTGGHAIVNNNSPQQEVSRIFTENDAYYIVGYETSNAKPDGKMHRLDVKVNRPGVEVHTRTKYLAPPKPKPNAGPPPVLDNAIKDVLPVSAFAMRVNSASFALPGSRGKGVVALTLAMEVPTPTVRGIADVSVQARVFDLSGKEVAPRVQQTAHYILQPRPEPTQWVESIVRFDLPTGSYEVRLSATLPDGRAGSVYTDTFMPPFDKAPLWVSGLVLQATPSLPIDLVDSIGALLPVIPTTARTFHATDRVLAFLRIYQLAAKPPIAVSLRTSIVDADNTSVFDAPQSIDAAAFDKNAEADYRIPLPISKLSPGHYLLKIATAEPSGKVVPRAAVPFEVR